MVYSLLCCSVWPLKGVFGLIDWIFLSNFGNFLSVSIFREMMAELILLVGLNLNFGFMELFVLSI